ncbi:microcephalin [Pieris rapae]|uniref:microcephalin n=1 Tax=Pieris rapae TaxID=64459 RepID=UPI001E2819F4|nr:microcephalin [Pieris rapae]
MNKENNRSAAGLRRSAIAERKRLKEEWSVLKGIVTDKQENRNVLKKKQCNSKPYKSQTKEIKGPEQVEACEVLRGVVALVEVGAESCALGLRAALMALGASVVPAWSPLITHLIWTHGGCRKVRARARALACHLVSPLWVEACAAAAKRQPERIFPAPSRSSDLPSPATLRILLKKAEHENIPLIDFLSDSRESDEENAPRLRISSETDSTDKKAHDKSTGESHDQNAKTLNQSANLNNSPNKNSPSRVNTRPRGLPKTDKRPTNTRRKLFTYREDAIVDLNDERETPTPVQPKKHFTYQQRQELIQAERIARKIIKTPIKKTQRIGPILGTQRKKIVPRIVLTGMSKSERSEVHKALNSLDCKIKSKVTYKTTHIIFGSCQDDNRSHINQKCTKPRTVNALLGAIRGCRVLGTQWAIDSAKEGQWLPHYGYEVPHLLKISTKARVERAALGRMRSEYAYDIFNGFKVKIQSNAHQKLAITELLTLCGAIIQDGGCDVTIGQEEGEINSKWVFDSVASGRMRTTRRYVNKNIPDIVSLTQSWSLSHR